MGGCTSSPQNMSPNTSPAKKPLQLSTEPSSTIPVPAKTSACDDGESVVHAPVTSEGIIPDEHQSDSDHVILPRQNSEYIQFKEKAPSPPKVEENKPIKDDGDATCCCYPSDDQLSVMQISFEDPSARELQIVIEEPKEEYEESERRGNAADEAEKEGKVDDAKLQKTFLEETDRREAVDLAECQENSEEDEKVVGERMPILQAENQYVAKESAEVMDCCWSPFDDQSSLTQIPAADPSVSEAGKEAVEDAKIQKISTECLVSNTEEDGIIAMTASQAENQQIVAGEAAKTVEFLDYTEEDKINEEEQIPSLQAEIDSTIAEGADIQQKFSVNESEQQQTLVAEESERPMRSISEQVEDFYRVHNPSKLKDIPFILQKYAGKEDGLLEKLKLQYKVSESEPVPPTFLERLEKFYRFYKPDNLDKVPSILEKYKGRELELFDHLQQKYNSAPI